MDDWYNELKKLDGHPCFTLRQNKPAMMHIDDSGVTIEYPPEGVNKLSRSLLDETFRKLHAKGLLTLKDVHNDITHRDSAITDCLMEVLREIPGIGFTSNPRTLFVKK